MTTLPAIATLWAAFDEQPVYLAILAPVLLAGVSGSRSAVAGSILLALASLIAVAWSPEPAYRIVAPAALTVVAIAISIMGFELRSQRSKTDGIRRRLAAAERSISDTRERLVLRQSKAEERRPGTVLPRSLDEDEHPHGLRPQRRK